MGCGASKNGGGGRDAANNEEGGTKAGTAAPGGRRQSVVKEVANIKVASGDAVKLTNLPRVIFIFGND